MQDPVIILAPARSFTSVVGAMLGQHPQLYGLLEVNLFVAATMRARQTALSSLPRSRHHGLQRTVAQLFAGGQTPRTINFACGWIERRIAEDRSCASVFRELAERVSPRRLVDKSHTTLRHAVNLSRLVAEFPDARFIHLLRHPRSQGESLWALKTKHEQRWMEDNFEPQRRWYLAHRKIMDFLDGLPAECKLRVRGETLLAEPDPELRRIADWLGLRTDDEAIDAMKHPERSPYAAVGPDGARGGTDPNFMRAPELRQPAQARQLTLEGPLSWRPDDKGFLPEVKQLARDFGYQ